MDMGTGAMKQQEHASKPAAAWLRGNRDNKHKADDISFVMDSLAMNFCRGMCKLMNNIMIKRIDDRRAKTQGTCMPIGNSAAVHKGQRHDCEETSPEFDHA